MPDPYAPPVAEIDTPRPPLEDLAWVRATRWILGFCGAMYLLLGLVAAPALSWVMAHDEGRAPMPAWFDTFMGGFLFVLCAGFGAVNFLAAWGLRQGRTWGWVLSLVIGGIYTPSGCLPFGALILYGLLNERVRKAYLGRG